MQVKKLKLHIDNILPNAKWNFDLQDNDKILRVDSQEDVVVKIIELLQAHQYSCEELD